MKKNKKMEDVVAESLPLTEKGPNQSWRYRVRDPESENSNETELSPVLSKPQVNPPKSRSKLRRFKSIQWMVHLRTVNILIVCIFSTILIISLIRLYAAGIVSLLPFLILGPAFALLLIYLLVYLLRTRDTSSCFKFSDVMIFMSSLLGSIFLTYVFVAKIMHINKDMCVD